MNIYDIAQQCGVSIATVSRVLNGSPNVSAKTRDKILEVMKKQDYTPNAFARGLGLNSMKMIGILCTDIQDTFYAKAVSLVEGLLRQNGFNTLLSCTGNSLENKKKSLDLLLKQRVDAVILVGSAFKENLDNSHIENAAKQVPVMIINGYVELDNCYCVLCDERSAVRHNVSLLHKQGYNDILYLYDALTYSGYEKIAGYKEGLQKNGLEFKETLMVKINKSLEDAAMKVTEMMDSGISFSAIMASEDLLAIGALKALQKKHMQMPVIGFNNSILALCSSPSLTSIDNMIDTMCPTAITMLKDILNGKNVPLKVVVYPKLVERETFRTKKNI